MQSLAAFKAAVTTLQLRRGIGGTVKFSACRRFAPRQNTRYVSTLLPSVHWRSFEHGHSGKYSAGRVAQAALEAKACEEISSSNRRRASQAGLFILVTRRLKNKDSQRCRPLGSHGNFEHKLGAVMVIQSESAPPPARTTPNPDISRAVGRQPRG